MRKRIRVTVQFLTAVAAAALPAARLSAQSTDAIIDRAASAWAKVTTVRGTFEQTVTNALTGSSANSRGTYAQERPNRLAIRFEPSGSDAIVADGRNVWVYLPSSAPGQVVKRAATDRSALPIDLTGQFLDAPRKKYDMVAAGTRTVSGHPAHGLTLVPKGGTSAPFAKATVWIDDDDALIREFEETEASGVTRHVRLTSVELNAPVDRSQFTFSVPKGVRIVDQTATPG
jgi:outer membrane lipoprotein carrier protein